MFLKMCDINLQMWHLYFDHVSLHSGQAEFMHKLFIVYLAGKRKFVKCTVCPDILF